MNYHSDGMFRNLGVFEREMNTRLDTANTLLGCIYLRASNHVDLILTFHHAILDGYEATRKVRETLQSTPIIGLSAHAMAGHEQKAREAGYNDYLTKPLGEDVLIQKLTEYLG